MIITDLEKPLPALSEKRGLEAQLVDVDQPPPYVVPPNAVASPSTSTRAIPHHAQTMPEPIRSSSTFGLGITQRANRISIFSKQNVITGSYLVDPALPAVSRSNPLVRARSESDDEMQKADWRAAREMRRAFGESGRRLGGLLRGQPPSPNATFRTRHGDISIDLGVVGSPIGLSKDRMRARVMLVSRQGHIHVNLFELQDARCIDLGVSTRGGNIFIFFPPSYSGQIVVHSRRGFSPSSFALLPEFAARATTVRGSDRESRLILAPTPDANGQAPPERAVQDADHTMIRTRSGKVTLGLCGLDVIDLEPPSAGLFKKLGDFIQSQARVLEGSLTNRVLDSSLARKISV